MGEVHTMLWRRLDHPGHESAGLLRRNPGWQLTGTAVFVHEHQPCRLDYVVICDAGWRTLSARVNGWVGDTTVEVEATSVAPGRWRLGGAPCPVLEGCVDVDLSFSPATNLLPIRRLHLAIGEEATVRAAWLRFPGFELEPLEQLYRRTDDNEYRYESAGRRFVAHLHVDPHGFVTDYPGFWRVEEMA